MTFKARYRKRIHTEKTIYRTFAAFSLNSCAKARFTYFTCWLTACKNWSSLSLYFSFEVGIVNKNQSYRIILILKLCEIFRREISISLYKLSVHVRIYHIVNRFYLLPNTVLKSLGKTNSLILIRVVTDRTIFYTLSFM